MGGSSWLTAVKRAFRSPTKDAQKKTARRTREQHNDQELDEDEKKREKRRWLFRKHSATAPPPPTKSSAPVVRHPTPHDHSHAIAMAAATAAAAEAAVATAQAAVEIIRLTRSSNPPNNINPSSIKQNYAAIMIQKAFRGYLARRALVALRGIVKLQALIRGQNVRKQAKMTLRCMQALLRLQTRMHPSRLSQDGGSRKSMFAENTNSFFWDNSSKQIPENIRERRSMSRDRIGSNSSIDWNWNDCPRTLQELEECLQSRKEAALRRESSSSSSLAQKIWNAENEMNGEGTNWLEQWMETKQWRDEQQQQQQKQHYYRENNRVSTDRRDSFVKTVEMDNNSTPKRRAHSAATCPSPSRSSIKAPSTPSSKMRTPPPSSQSYSHSAANTPSLRSVQRLSSSISRNTAPPAVPNYMAATESARARIRSQSAPRQRPSTPERDRGSGGGGAGMMAKKRLSFPVPPPANGSYSQNLRSPSFKSVQAGYVGMEQQSNQSCYTDSIGGEISPCSTTELRWWLRT